MSTYEVSVYWENAFSAFESLKKLKDNLTKSYTQIYSLFFQLSGVLQDIEHCDFHFQITNNWLYRLFNLPSVMSVDELLTIAGGQDILKLY